MPMSRQVMPRFYRYLKPLPRNQISGSEIGNRCLGGLVTCLGCSTSSGT